ncbi:hypothetical protein B0H16DRAFT_1809203 [Mycena metata]|uniref:Uncharacterized protein n=1 Tax=Mycena metata TaxID=1033252 RepID=A0AAD7H6W3_9AGAR|nr:hypothetical protein B0H16DRAFT_1809203 [Mycena metata]
MVPGAQARVGLRGGKLARVTRKAGRKVAMGWRQGLCKRAGFEAGVGTVLVYAPLVRRSHVRKRTPPRSSHDPRDPAARRRRAHLPRRPDPPASSPHPRCAENRKSIGRGLDGAGESWGAGGERQGNCLGWDTPELESEVGGTRYAAVDGAGRPAFRMCGTLSPCLTRFVFCESPALLGAACRASGVGWRRMLSLAEETNVFSLPGPKISTLRLSAEARIGRPRYSSPPSNFASRGFDTSAHTLLTRIPQVVYLKTLYSKLRAYIGRYGLGRWKGRSKGEEGRGCRGGERRRGEKKREGVGCGTVRTVCARQQNLQRWARGLDPRGVDAQAHSSMCTSLSSCATAEPSLAQSALASTARAGAAVCGGYRGVYDGGDRTSIPQRPPPARGGSEQMDDSKLVIGVAIFEFNHRPACRMEYRI